MNTRERRRLIDRRRSFYSAVGGGFRPDEIDAVSAWHRLSDPGTVINSGRWESVAEVLGGTAFTQSTADARPTVGSSNGYPIAVFDGVDDRWIQTIDAGCNTSPAAGFAIWFRLANISVFKAIMAANVQAGSSVGRVVIEQRNATIHIEVNQPSSTNVRVAAATGVQPRVWYFLYWDFDGDEVADADACRILINTLPLAPMYSDDGGAAGVMPDTLNQPTGNRLIGMRRTSDLLRPFAGDMGGDSYDFNRRLTADELTALYLYRPPTPPIPLIVTAWLDADNTDGFGTTSFFVWDKAPASALPSTGVQTNTSRQPTISGGRFLFDGTADSITITNNSSIQFTAGGAYVFKINAGYVAPASDQDLFSHWGADERTTIRIRPSGNIEWGIAIDTFTFAIGILDASDIDLTADNVLTLIFTGNSLGATTNATRCRIRVNGVDRVLAFSGTIPAVMRADGAATPRLGSFGESTNYYSGAVEHLIVCNAVPTPEQLSIIEGL